MKRNAKIGATLNSLIPTELKREYLLIQLLIHAHDSTVLDALTSDNDRSIYQSQ